MLVQTGGLSAFTNDFLPRKYGFVSFDVDGGSILQEPVSGRDGRGGITFTTGNDDNSFAYDLYVQDAIPAADTQIFGIALRQTATQHAPSGRLLTLVDGGEDIFGETTQVGINVMPDGTLQAVRANAQGTGVVLRGLTDPSPELTLLGQSTTAIDATDTEFVVITVFHDAAVGSITVTFYDDTGAIKGTWTLENVNTAISGRNQSNSFCYGGYAYTDGVDRFHQDLQAVISDLYIVNNIVDPDDSRNPTTSIGNRKPLMTLPDAAGGDSEWTPAPAQANYLNVNETPPNEGTTENSTDTIDATDTMGMQDESGDEEVIVAYSAFVVAGAPPECGASGDPATFEAFVYTEQTDPGEVHTTPPTGPPCNLSDFVSRRAQSVCTIGKNGEKVTFKPLSVNVQTDAYFVALTPLDKPPRLQDPSAPGYFAQANFHPKGEAVPVIGFSLADNVNTTAVPGRVSYNLSWFEPWQGLASDTDDIMNTSGDFFEFKLLNDGISIDVGVIENNIVTAPFSPYSSPTVAFHFREHIPGAPFFWIGPSFGYANETIYNHNPGDTYRIVRNDPNIELYQNGFLLETFTPGVLNNLVAYTFMGRWGFDAPFGYTKRPGITDAFVQIGALDCCPAFYDYACLDGQFQANAPEMQQWGVKFNDGFPDCFIYDPGSTHGPFPQAGYDANTRWEFSLEGGNVVMRIYNPTFLSGIPNVGGVGTWTYTIPYANTDDFRLQSPISFGPPDFPNQTLEYEFVDAQANQPLRLGVIFGADNFGVTQGLIDVSFTFAGESTSGPMKGVMVQDTNTRLGTQLEPPTDVYRYRQSMLASTPTDEPITVADFNESQHGYRRVVDE